MNLFAQQISEALAGDQGAVCRFLKRPKKNHRFLYMVPIHFSHPIIASMWTRN